MTIRRQPEDFVVHERLAEEFHNGLVAGHSAQARHAVYQLSKTSLATPEAIQRLAKALGTRHAVIAYAGLKDKHAQTTQHVSAPFDDPARAASLPPEVSGPGWSARHLGWSDHEISAQSIDGNRFTIVVRDLSRDAANQMHTRATLLALADGSLIVTNYFGDQRFGSARHGRGWIARALIAGDFESALKLAIATPARKDSGKTRDFTRLAATAWGAWDRLARELPRCPERAPIEALAQGATFRDAFTTLPYFLQSMYVEAFQSHLWNRTAHRLMASLAHASQHELLVTPDAFGELAFAPASALDEAWQSLDLPLLDKGTFLHEPWKDAALASLSDEGLTQADLRIPGLRRPYFGEAPRQLFIRALEFFMSPPERDELSGPSRWRRTVVFGLPRGSYATVVLRALGQ